MTIGSTKEPRASSRSGFLGYGDLDQSKQRDTVIHHIQETMNESISKYGFLSDSAQSEHCSGRRRASAPVRTLASSLTSSMHSGERRSCISDSYVKISFDKVFVYEFALALGDNPAVREGCPIALGRKCIHQTVIDMDSFEQSRRCGRKRRRAKDLYIPVQDRAALLMSQGYTLEKIVETVLEVEKIKKSRQECMKLNGWQKFKCATDSAGRSLLRKLTSGNSNKSKPSSDRNNSLNDDNDDIKVGQAARTA